MATRMGAKDFELVAEALRFDTSSVHSENVRVNACWRLANSFAKQYPRFNRDKFLADCGIQSND